MTYKWYETTGRFSGSLEGTSKSPTIFNVRANMLTASTFYQFKVVAFMTDDPSINNTATIDVDVGQQELIAIILGGAKRQVPMTNILEVYYTILGDPQRGK